jgi:hypothetical protein
MEIELSEQREIIDSALNMSFKSYLKEIGTDAYNDEQYYQIAVYQLKLKQIKELKYLLVSLTNKFRNRQIIKIDALKLKKMEQMHTENMNELLDMFNIDNKFELLDEHESRKALIFLKTQLIDNDSNDINQHSLLSLNLTLKN